MTVEREAVPEARPGLRRAGGIESALMGALLLVLALHVAWIASGWRPAALLPWLGDLPEVVSLMLSAAVAWRAARRCQDAGKVKQMRAWVFFAFGQALWSLGEFYYFLQDRDGVTALFPGYSDLFFLLLPVMFVLGMLQLPRARLDRQQALSFTLDVSIVMATLAAMFWSQFMSGNLATYRGQPLQLLVAQAYPVSDLLLFAILLVVLLWRPAGVAGLSLLPFAGGLLLFFAADTWYAVQTGAGTYVNGAWSDALWTAAAVAFGVSAMMVQRPLRRSERRLLGGVERLQRGLTVLPYVAVTVVYTLLTTATDHRGARAFGVLIAALSVTALVLIRQFMALRENRHLSERLRYEAAHDALTGLVNRSALMREVDAAILRTHATSTLAAVLFIDLDRFKAVNDTLGHAAGDALLVSVAERLRTVVRDGDTVARLGGDEFVLLLEGLTDSLQATLVAERTVAVLARPFRVAGQDASIGGSVGVTLIPQDALTADEAMRHADLAMYAAKTGGRSGYALFDAVLAGHHRTRTLLEKDLRGAGERGELSVVYQPQFTAAGALRGMEALLRWSHPQHGPVTPEVFISMAEEGNFVHELGAYAMNAVLEQLHRWDGLLSGLSVSLNVSPVEFNRPDFVRQVRSLLNRHHVTARQLTLELTERCMSQDPEVAQMRLLELRTMGLRVSLDDFGTGHSSLSSLRTIGADELKLDRSLSRDLTPGSQSEAVFRAVVGIGHSLGLTVLAEGIETEQVRDVVTACGVDDLQGYLLSRPLPGEEMQALLERRAAQNATAALS